MKRLWLVLLSLGLIAAFSTQAMAVDVKFSGDFNVGGVYLDNTGLADGAGENAKPSSAFFFQRLRLQTDFVVDKGLKLVTRADIMERVWGQRTPVNSNLASDSVATREENENIAFDLAYIEYISPIGLFQVGYIMQGNWGTNFSNSAENGETAGGINYVVPIKSFYLFATMYQVQDGNRTAINSTSTASDADYNLYQGGFVFKPSEKFQAGLVVKRYEISYYRDLNPILAALGSPTGTPFKMYATGFSPYFKGQFGPVYVEGEFAWGMGQWDAENDYYHTNTAATGRDDNDIDEKDMIAYLSATADFGVAYVGGTFAYISGDDPATKDDREGGLLAGGNDWNPCMLMWNYERSYWAGSFSGYDGTTNGKSMSNAIFFQVKGGVRPVDKLDLMASVSYATVDKTPAMQWEGRDYGWEVDLTATYKLTSNLSYMLGGAYWFVGDYFYGTTDEDRDLEDNYMVINKLTLSF